MVQRDQKIIERAEVGQKVIATLKELLGKQPVEVLGHMDLAGLCCSGGTVAIVRVDLEKVVLPR